MSIPFLGPHGATVDAAISKREIIQKKEDNQTDGPSRSGESGLVTQITVSNRREQFTLKKIERPSLVCTLGRLN